MNNSAINLFNIDNMVIFCRGQQQAIYNIIDEFEECEDKSIRVLNLIMREHHAKDFDNNLLEIVVVQYEENMINTYYISSSNEFIPTRWINPPDQTHIHVAGTKSEELLNSARCNTGNLDKIEDFYKKVYNEMVCPEIGGNITLYEVTKSTKKLLDNFRLDDNNSPIDFFLKKTIKINE
jgi:hypothetical protein